VPSLRILARTRSVYRAAGRLIYGNPAAVLPGVGAIGKGVSGEQRHNATAETLLNIAADPEYLASTCRGGATTMPIAAPGIPW